MQVPDANHPLWSILQLGVLFVVLGLCLALTYTCGFDEVKDLRTMMIVTVSGAGMELLKRMIAPAKDA